MIPRHSQLPPDLSTAQGTAIHPTDHSHRYTRTRPAPPHSHAQPHPTHSPTEQWPNHHPIARSSASPELPSPHSQSRHPFEHTAGPSSPPDIDQPSSSMTSSPHILSTSTELPPQSTAFEQKSIESHSGKKRHKCNVCGSYWGRPSSLKIHMVSHTGVKGNVRRRRFFVSAKLIPAHQNSCVPFASKTLASNQIIPDTSESTTKTRAKESRPAPLAGGGVGLAELARLGPYDL